VQLVRALSDHLLLLLLHLHGLAQTRGSAQRWPRPPRASPSFSGLRDPGASGLPRASWLSVRGPRPAAPLTKNRAVPLYFFTPVVPIERNPRAGPSCDMLSGVKLVPRDQILSGRKHGSGGGGGSDSDSSSGKRRAKRSKGGRDKREKGNRRRSRRRRYSSEDESGSDTDDSIGEEEEEDVSRSKRRGKHRRRRHNFSDDDSESSESDKGRAGGKGKQKGDGEDDEDEDDTGGEGLRASEVVRREMGLEWLLKSASSSRAEGSSVRKVDNDEKDDAAHEEVMAMNHLTWCMSGVLV